MSYEDAEWWTVEQAAEVSGLSKWCIRKLCREGVFRTRQPGRRWQIESSGFVAWLLESYR
ncbi:helix-turn-helix domain-containing protein [Bifidobacterium longum]|mgnify:FL=1|uniref:helix-turn-helix domain-containing protein n=1 Tax=Bifidobacterium longum TaxID=216816 RepID=UPI001F3E0108|nr:helix-turn-helix domain-containing protein [Bifidobacterium longum]UIP49893.1 helix-turn-helix domain-containing protein [Bifidobacterium longum]